MVEGGSSGRRTLFAAAATLAGLALAVALVVTGRPAGAQQNIDISGEWNVSVEGSIELSCAVTFAQAGADLTQLIDCGGVSGSFAGTIDPGTGIFSIDGSLFLLPIHVAGTASDGGNRISGNWTGDDFFNGSFHGTRRTSAEVREEVTGVWELEFVSELEVCLATLEQAETRVAATLECPGRPRADLAGPASATGFVLSGSAREHEGELAGNFSRDRLAFVGVWRPASGGSGTTVLGVRRAVDATQFNLTGQWNTTLSGGFPLTCTSAIGQSGLELTSLAACGVIPTISLVGSIDAEHGTFALADRDRKAYAIRGRVNEDGSLTGAWFATFASIVLSGTLAGHRISDTPLLVNLAGNWEMHMDGRLVGDCTAYIEHPAGDLRAFEEMTSRIDCGPGLTGSLTGGVSQPAGQFSLHGLVGTMQFQFRGQTSGCDALEGVWSAARPRRTTGKDEDFEQLFANFGCFAARRSGSDAPLTCEPPRHHPDVQVDCFGSCPTPMPPPPGKPLSIIAIAGASDNDGLLYGALGGLAVEVAAIGFWSIRSRRH
jgi:hypothetical protein